MLLWWCWTINPQCVQFMYCVYLRYCNFKDAVAWDKGMKTFEIYGRSFVKAYEIYGRSFVSGEVKVKYFILEKRWLRGIGFNIMQGLKNVIREQLFINSNIMRKRKHPVWLSGNSFKIFNRFLLCFVVFRAFFVCSLSPPDITYTWMAEFFAKGRFRD